MHLGRGDVKEHVDEEDRKEELETEETKVLWDRREEAASKELRDQLECRVKLDLKGRKETEGLGAFRELKESLVNRFQLRLLLFLL